MKALIFFICTTYILSTTNTTNSNNMTELDLTITSDNSSNIDINATDIELEQENIHNKKILKEANIINKTYVRQNAIINWETQLANFEPAELITINIPKGHSEVFLK